MKGFLLLFILSPHFMLAQLNSAPVFSDNRVLQRDAPAQIENKLPNIIYIYADDLGYGSLGCYGQQKIKTPRLDSMAKEGMRFTQHYAGSPVCAPSRAILLTGKHAGHAAIRGNFELGGFADSAERGQQPLPGNAFTVAELLKKKNYLTAAIGKWGLGMTNTEGSPLKQGFDQFYGYLDQKQAHNHYPTHLWENAKWDTLDQPYINVHLPLNPGTATDEAFQSFSGKEYASDKITARALAFIEKSHGKPFFLYLAYPLPHASLQVPGTYRDMYTNKFPDQIYYGQQGYASTKTPLSTYAGMITYLDEQVGLILDKIKSLGLDSTTIIFFSSDNGPSKEGGVDTEFFNANGGLRGLKRDLYEGGIRVPFIVRWPGRVSASVTSNVISAQYDFFATVAALTGQSAIKSDGISLLNVLLGREESQFDNRNLYFEFAEKSGQVAIRKGNWKAVKSNLNRDPDAQWELYNLVKDPRETNNVAEGYPALIRQFNTILKKERQPPIIPEWDFNTGTK